MAEPSAAFKTPAPTSPSTAMPTAEQGRAKGGQTKAAAVLGGLVLLNIVLAFAVLAPSGGAPQKDVLVSNGISVIPPVSAVLPKPTVASAPSVSNAPAPAPTREALPQGQTCRVWGPFLPDEVRKVQASLANWNGTVAAKEQAETVGYVVFWPVDKAREGGGLAELKTKGISDVFVFQSQDAMKGAISLGAFRTEGAAAAHRASMQAKGLQGVQVMPRTGAVKTVFRLEGNAAQIDALLAIRNAYGKGDFKPCE